MKKSEFNKKDYDIKYNKEYYKQLKLNLKPEDFDLITDFCERNNIVKSKFILAACKYFINNDKNPLDE